MCHILRRRRCLCSAHRHGEAVQPPGYDAAVRWLCVERTLHARCMRAACALHARFMRASCAGHSLNAPAKRCALVDFLPRALCMRYACALHTYSALETRCACVVNSLASSKFCQKFDAQRRTGHIFNFSMRGPWSAVAQLVECRTRNRESPGSNPRCYRFEVWAFSFTSRRLSRLSCINEYLAIDSGENVSE